MEKKMKSSTEYYKEMYEFIHKNNIRSYSVFLKLIELNNVWFGIASSKQGYKFFNQYFKSEYFGEKKQKQT